MTNYYSIEFIGHIISMVGASCIVFAYFAIERNWLNSKSLKFYLINLIGSILLLISLYISFNLGSVIINIFWAIISISGIINDYKNQ
jgi:hypothetical protein